MNYQEIKKNVFDGQSQAHKKLNNYGKEVNRLVAYTEHLERAYDYACNLIVQAQNQKDISKEVCNDNCSHREQCTVLDDCIINNDKNLEKREWKTTIWKNTN